MKRLTALLLAILLACSMVATSVPGAVVRAEEDTPEEVVTEEGSVKETETTGEVVEVEEGSGEKNLDKESLKEKESDEEDPGEQKKETSAGVKMTKQAAGETPSKAPRAAVTSWTDLKTAIESGGTQTIELPASLTSDGTLITIPEGVDITLKAESSDGAAVTRPDGKKLFKVEGKLTIDGTDGRITLQTEETTTNTVTQFIEVAKSAELHLTSMTIDGKKNFDGSWGGGLQTSGAIDANGAKVYMTDVTVQNCNSGHGVAVYAKGGTYVEMTDCNISNNRTANSNMDGGAVRAEKSTIVATNCTFDKNLPRQSLETQPEMEQCNGGGAFVIKNNSEVTLSNCEITNNVALAGSGIFCQNSKLKISGSLIQGNGISTQYDAWHYGQGGGLYMEDGTLEITDTDIKDNQCYFLGGGIYLYGTSLTLGSDVEISGNSAAAGGGIFVDGCAITVKGAKIADNKAIAKEKVASSSSYGFNNGKGGGIFLNDSAGEATINTGTISGNAADQWGGGIMNYYGTVYMSGGTIEDNTASEGEAVYQAGNFAISVSPSIKGEVYLATVDNSGPDYPCVITVVDEYKGSAQQPVLIDVMRDNLYKPGRDVVEYVDSLPVPDNAEILKYELVPDIPYIIDNEPGKEHILELSEKKFIVRPEDQTIYTGGEDGSVDNAEFPHPIYLDAAKGMELADDLTFKVNGTEWNDPDNEYPFTVKYYEKKSDGTAGGEITNDEHYGDFIAKIVPVDGVDADKITLADDTKVSFADGTLRIRYVSSFTEASGNELTVEAVTYDPSDAASKAQAQKQAEELAVQEEAVTAILPEDTDILLNGKSAYVYPDNAQDKISLLCDELLPVSADEDNSQREGMLLDKAQDEGFNTDGYESTFRYLDLVDENNSNAWVASTKGTDVFWAYPEGVDEDSDIQLLHFTGLHREYQMNGQSLADQVAASEVEKVPFEKTEAGIWFHIDQSGFSPFLLNWESTSASQIPDGSESKPEAEVEDAGKQTTPKTGDPADLAGWLLALTVSGILIGGIASGSRKRRG